MTSLLKHIDDLFSASESARSESPLNQWTGYAAKLRLKSLLILDPEYSIDHLTGIDEKARSPGKGNEPFEEEIWRDSVLNLFSSNLKANTVVLSLLKYVYDHFTNMP